MSDTYAFHRGWSGHKCQRCGTMLSGLGFEGPCHAPEGWVEPADRSDLPPVPQLTPHTEPKQPSDAAKAYMALLTNELVGMAEGVRREGGIRKLLLRFPNEQSVSIVLIRQNDLERAGLDEHLGKGRHPYQEQMEIKPVCAWCGAERNHPVHV